jgi:LacI family transcriptional regulator
MPTIRDVAKLAGVAPITVSRVINDSGYVHQDTRQRVEAAIEELGYVPNMLGPSLRFQQTLTLAAVISDITNPFWTTVTRGIEDVAQASGYSTILCNTDESEEKQDQYLHMLLRRRIDGILLVPATGAPAPIELVQKQDVPLVILDRVVPGIAVDTVRADSQSGAQQLTQHLLSLGHQRIAMLSGPKQVSTAVDRATGYQNALSRAGLSQAEEQIFWGEYTQESGRKMALQALGASYRPTALFAANNFIAVGALQAIHESGLRVPEDISVVAVDDIPPTYTPNPFLTVVTQPAREMGQQAAKLLLDRIDGRNQSPPQQIIMPTEMILRSSSGKI